MQSLPPIDMAMADYFVQRFGRPEDKAPFRLAFSAVQTALAAGHTAAQYPDMEFNNPNLIANFAKSTHAPLLTDGKRLWLQRIWQAEHTLATEIQARMAAKPLPLALDKAQIETSCAGLNVQQQQALQQAITHCFTMINGGPGTGKTFTVARLVALLAQAGQADKLALAAPTGKAAKRMELALQQALSAEKELSISIPQAQTLHRLLGLNHEDKAQYHREQRLPYEVVIVDEASMLSLELAAQLFAAVAPNARLILLGDAQQLAAVEAGAVLQDLSHHSHLQSALVTLQESKRFDAQSGIGQLARLVLQGKASKTALNECIERFSELKHHELSAELYTQLAQGYQRYFQALRADAEPEVLLELFDEYRVLVASHHGALGSEQINQRLRHLYLQQRNQVDTQRYFHGLPLMISANDYDNEVFNGDIGLCLQGEDERLRFHLPHKTLLMERLNPAHLQPAYALSIHKSQGSEFAHVALVIDKKQDKLLSRELLYTGITRAKQALTLYADTEALIQAIDSPTQRSTGLAVFL